MPLVFLFQDSFRYLLHCYRREYLAENLRDREAVPVVIAERVANLFLEVLASFMSFVAVVIPLADFLELLRLFGDLTIEPFVERDVIQANRLCLDVIDAVAQSTGDVDKATSRDFFNREFLLVEYLVPFVASSSFR